MIKRRAAAALLAVVLTAVMVFSAGGLVGADQPKIELKVIINPNPGFEAAIWVDRTNYMPGDTVAINYRVTQDAYVYVWDIDTEGNVRLLLPNIYESGNWAQGGRTYTIPSNNRYRLQVTGPYGTETLVIVASKQPLPETGWLQNAIRSGEFMPKVGDSAEQFFGQVRSLQIQPIPQQNWVSAFTTFQVGPGRPVGPVVPIVPRAADVRVESSPALARVFLDGREVGVTPMTLYDVPRGEHEITLIKDGYYAFVRRFDVDGTGDVNISGYLNRISQSTPPSGSYGTLLMDQVFTVSSTNDKVELPFGYAGSSGKFTLTPYGGSDKLIERAVGNALISGSGGTMFTIYSNQTSSLYSGWTDEYSRGSFRVRATLVDYGIGYKNVARTPYFQFMTWRVQVWWTGK